MEKNVSRPPDGRGKRPYVVRISPALRSRAVSACRGRCCTLSDLVRSGIAALSLAEVDTVYLPELVRCIDAAGTLLNSAAHGMNSCASRFGEVSTRNINELKTFEHLVVGSSEASSLAATATAPLCRAASYMDDVSFVMSDEAVVGGEGRYTCSCGIRLSDSERDALRKFPCGSAATLRLALTVATEWDGKGFLIVIEPSSVTEFNRAVGRWKTNVTQIHTAAKALAGTQSTSRYLSAQDAAKCRNLLSRAREQADGALFSLGRAVNPIAVATEAARAERNIVMFSVRM